MLIEEIDGEDLNLEPVETVLDKTPVEFGSIFRIGRPVIVDAVKQAALDDVDLAPEVLLQLTELRFLNVRLDLSVRPPQGVDVRFLALEVELDAENGSAIAWALAPERVDEPMTVAVASSLTADLKLGLARVRPGLERTTQYVVLQPRLLAFNIGTREPAWEFEPTRGTTLRGVQTLHLVVAATRSAGGCGSVALRADVVRKGVLWNTRAHGRHDRRYASVFAWDAQ